jgi:hypothetical protein
MRTIYCCKHPQLLKSINVQDDYKHLIILLLLNIVICASDLANEWATLVFICQQKLKFPHKALLLEPVFFRNVNYHGWQGIAVLTLSLKLSCTLLEIKMLCLKTSFKNWSAIKWQHRNTMENGRLDCNCNLSLPWYLHRWRLDAVL